MATGRQPSKAEADRRDADGRLEPFSGVLSPGIAFESGHCFWFFHFESTPTAIGTYDHVWLISPAGERTLYVDPLDAGSYVQTYHAFDRVHGATISWEPTSSDGRANDGETGDGTTTDSERRDGTIPDNMAVSVDGDDGTTIELQVDLAPSTGTRLLGAITALTPTAVLRSGIGERISNRTFSLLMDVNDLKVAGTTDTGEPYRVEPDALRVATDASATLNGDDLGELTPPNRPIEFGDAVAPNTPLVSFGDSCLRPPAEADPAVDE